ncbi:MAG: Rpn family recombination-promoting nuclease/putative transposase [Bacteroidetes bacterium]|nr:Rpn family recombination-promoting nuclease/putative transposase [Bacteroidota bacterium]
MLKDIFVYSFTTVGLCRLFGEKGNKDLRINFLNSLYAGVQQINDLRYLKSRHIISSDTERNQFLLFIAKKRRARKLLLKPGIRIITTMDNWLVILTTCFIYRIGQKYCGSLL